MTTKALRKAACKKIECDYYFTPGNKYLPPVHEIYRGGKHGQFIAHGSTFNNAMRYALEVIYSGEEPPVPKQELLVG